MEKFELHIFDSGSALLATCHFPTSQIVSLRDRLFMMDYGEGAQLQFRKSCLRFPRLNRIFISHLCGGRCFELPGLISTLNLLGRTADLHIHFPKGLEKLFTPMLAFFNHQMTCKIFFHAFGAEEAVLICGDHSPAMTAIPLRHRMPYCGFLFAEKSRPNYILRDMTDFYQVPVYGPNRIKNDADYVTPEGEMIPDTRLTRPSAAPRYYTYYSDTIYLPSMTEQIKGIDLPFHGTTFAEDAAPRAKETFHTTAS